METPLDLKHCAAFIQSCVKMQELMYSPLLPLPNCKSTFPHLRYIYGIHIKHFTAISFFLDWLSVCLSIT